MFRTTKITPAAGAIWFLLIVALGVILAAAATHAGSAQLHPNFVPLNQQLHSIASALTRP
jgi:hypothetical protein